MSLICLEDWMQKYEYIIDMGKELAPIEQKYKLEKPY